MLTCRDGFVQKVAWSCLRTVARRKTGISNPSEKELADYLIHKGRPVGDISNWRPLAMGNCVAKLYAAVLADRITVWAQREQQLSPEQKGFLTDEGCLEENFLLQSAIDDCRRSNK